MTVCSIDFETYGTIELKRTGVYPYAAHHDTGVWCMAFAFDDEEPQLWHPGEPFPPRLAEHIAAGGELRAWNAAFERVVWRDCARRRYGFPTVPDSQWFCTMAEACAMSLPRALDHAAQVLGVTEQKDMSGNRLSKQMCRPRKFDDAGVPVWWDDEPRLQKLYAYCLQDVRVERAVAKLVRRLVPRERALYLLDQKMNDRGVGLDYELAAKAREIAGREVGKQNALLAAATDGAASAITQVGKLKAWLATQGLEVDSLARKALDELLDGTVTLSPDVRAALEARSEAAKSSVAKLDAMLDASGRDNRLRGLLLYHGASTGRWTGKLVQPQNFPRGLDVVDVEAYIPHVLAGDAAELIDLRILSAMLRSMLVAGRGLQLTAVDFAAIEARVLAWLANETIMLEQFRGGRPIYKEMAAVIYGRPASEIVKPSPEYQIGKNTVLGCGFGMGYKKFAESTGVGEGIARAAVEAYRGTYSMVPRYWDNVNAAAIRAVEQPETVVTVGHVRFTRRGGYLWVVLPAGRSLAYAAPKIVERPVPWDKRELRPAVAFSGVNSYTRKWERMSLYGGLITENIVQAIARDLLADAMLRTEAAGYPIVLSVHDELVAESPANEQTLGNVLKIMKEVPEWAAGCPVDAEGWSGYRYRK